MKFVFESSLLWAPPNSHAYDMCPFDPNRFPSLFGYQSFAVMEVNGKHFICGYPLYCPEYGHKYMLWVSNLTCCWNPRREYIIYYTEKGTFTFVQGIMLLVFECLFYTCFVINCFYMTSCDMLSVI